MNETIQSRIEQLIVDVPDFPKPGVVFKDITPLLADASGWRLTIEQMAERIAPHRPDSLLAIESRGFIFGAALALELNLGVHIVRKPGKLPRATSGVSYDLEYGQDRLEMHRDVIERGERVAVIDDVLATGGTANAVSQLVATVGGEVACWAFLMELGFLNGRDRLGNVPIEAILHYS